MRPGMGHGDDCCGGLSPQAVHEGPEGVVVGGRIGCGADDQEALGVEPASLHRDEGAVEVSVLVDGLGRPREGEDGGEVPAVDSVPIEAGNMHIA